MFQTNNKKGNKLLINDFDLYGLWLTPNTRKTCQVITVKPFFSRRSNFRISRRNENSAKIKPTKIKIDKSHCRSVVACILYYTNKIYLICYPCLLKSMKYYTLLEYFVRYEEHCLLVPTYYYKAFWLTRERGKKSKTGWTREN